MNAAVVEVLVVVHPDVVFEPLPLPDYWVLRSVSLLENRLDQNVVVLGTVVGRSLSLSIQLVLEITQTLGPGWHLLFRDFLARRINVHVLGRDRLSIHTAVQPL